MEKYIKIARVYPSLHTMIIPWIIIVWSLGDLLPEVKEKITMIFSYIGVGLTSALVLGALGYALQETFRSTSKWIFQFPFFKEDQTKMPTTEMLLWKKKLMSKERHKNIAAKVKKMFNIQLPSEAKELLDEDEGRITIVDAVAQMRSVTRENKILLQYNYEFGFCRNYLGSSIYDLSFVIIAFVLNHYLNLMPMWGLIVALIIMLLSYVIAFISLKYRARAYADNLFTAFLGI